MRAGRFAVGCIGLFGCAARCSIQHPPAASRGNILRARSRVEGITKRGGATREGGIQRG